MNPLVNCTGGNRFTSMKNAPIVEDDDIPLAWLEDHGRGRKDDRSKGIECILTLGLDLSHIVKAQPPCERLVRTDGDDQWSLEFHPSFAKGRTISLGQRGKNNLEFSGGESRENSG